MSPLIRPRANAPLAVTMGEPSGIGGEILLMAWQALATSGPCFFALDDPARLQHLADAIGVEVKIRLIATPDAAAAVFEEGLPVLPLDAKVEAMPGRPDPANAGAVMASIAQAVALARSGRATGIVTNPIQKSTLYAAGFEFPGHTEYLAALTGAPLPVMLLASPSLKVVPVTIHIPLAAVPEALNADLIVETGRIVARDLTARFGMTAPRLALAGLNPHAGENGALGREDAEVVAPAVARLRAEGIDASGPLPADTMFHARARARYDVALCMYHDQALIPSKTLDFDGGVNVTLGLPIVRTSPDHGTALDIAGRGSAKPDSLIAAIGLAADMAARSFKE